MPNPDTLNNPEGEHSRFPLHPIFSCTKRAWSGRKMIMSEHYMDVLEGCQQLGTIVYLQYIKHKMLRGHFERACSVRHGWRNWRRPRTALPPRRQASGFLPASRRVVQEKTIILGAAKLSHKNQPHTPRRRQKRREGKPRPLYLHRIFPDKKTDDAGKRRSGGNNRKEL